MTGISLDTILAELGFLLLHSFKNSNYINNVYAQYRKLKKAQTISKKMFESPYPKIPTTWYVYTWHF